MGCEKSLLVERVEIVVDPYRAQCRCTARDIARIQQDLGRPHLSCGAERRIALEPGRGDRVGLARQGFLGVFPKRLLMRPIRVFFDEIGDVGKPAGAPGLA